MELNRVGMQNKTFGDKRGSNLDQEKMHDAQTPWIDLQHTVTNDASGWIALETGETKLNNALDHCTSVSRIHLFQAQSCKCHKRILLDCKLSLTTANQAKSNAAATETVSVQGWHSTSDQTRSEGV